MTVQTTGGGALQRQQETSSLADVVGTILDKGIVIDIFARVSLVGIELLRVDARIVVASVESYLKFAEAANRLELGTREPEQLGDIVGDVTQAGSKGVAEGKTKGAIETGVEKISEFLTPDDREEEPEERERSGRRSTRERHGSRR